jgi:O-antigen ligase
MTFRISAAAASLFAVSSLVGLLVASGHLFAAVAVAIAPLVFVAVARSQAFVASRPREVVVVAALWTTAIASTFVWRGRSTTQLYSNPLDTAALARVALIAVTLCLACAALLERRRSQKVPVPIILLGVYALVGAVSALGSPEPLNAAYRVVEIVAGIGAAVAALALLGPAAGRRALAMTMNIVSLLLIVVWIEAAVFPGHVWEPTLGLLRYTLNGYLPSYSSNTVGVFAGLLALWSLAQLLPGSPRRERRWSILPPWAGLILGLVTLVATQYRTGIIGFLAAGIAVMVVQRRYKLVLLLIVVLGLTVGFIGFDKISSTATGAFAKGHPDNVHTLDSRTVYWHASWKLTKERPLFGWGLNVGGRLALVSLGDDNTAGVHGTWPQALVDTGIVGFLALLAAFLSALGLGVRAASRAPNMPLAAAVLGMLTFLAIRSLTGPTLDSFNELFPIFVALVLAASAVRSNVSPSASGA